MKCKAWKNHSKILILNWICKLGHPATCLLPGCMNSSFQLGTSIAHIHTQVCPRGNVWFSVGLKGPVRLPKGALRKFWRGTQVCNTCISASFYLGGWLRAWCSVGSAGGAGSSRNGTCLMWWWSPGARDRHPWALTMEGLGTWMVDLVHKGHEMVLMWTGVYCRGWLLVFCSLIFVTESVSQMVKHGE